MKNNILSSNNSRAGRLVSLDVKTKLFLCARFSFLEREQHHWDITGAVVCQKLFIAPANP